MHTCENCGFKTSRLDNYKRHLNRKNACKPDPNVHANDPNVDQDVFVKLNECGKCGKCFSTKSNLNKHNKRCKGVIDSLQCEVCLKCFSTRKGKYQHKKNVNCKPPPEVRQPIAEFEQRQISELQEEISMLKIRKKGFTEGDKKRVASGQGWKCNLCDCNLPHTSRFVRVCVCVFLCIPLFDC